MRMHFGALSFCSSPPPRTNRIHVNSVVRLGPKITLEPMPVLTPFALARPARAFFA